jgi:hypothetical protein
MHPFVFIGFEKTKFLFYIVEGKRGPYQRTNAGSGYTLDFYACVGQRPYYTDMGPSPRGTAAQRQTDIFRKTRVMV